MNKIHLFKLFLLAQFFIGRRRFLRENTAIQLMANNEKIQVNW